MLEMKGKVNTAPCYARVVENESIEQVRRMCDRKAACDTSEKFRKTVSFCRRNCYTGSIIV